MGMPIPSTDAMATMTPQEARSHAKQLADKRKDIEEEIEAYIGTLQTQNVSLTSPLVDAEGFPIAGVDLMVVRSARARVHMLRNDLKRLDDELRSLVDLAFAVREVTPPTTRPIQPGERKQIATSHNGGEHGAPAQGKPVPAPSPSPLQPSAHAPPMTRAAASSRSDHAVGTSVPPATPHAVSVSLPRWQDNVDYEEGRLADVMETGYPRFFIHRSIQKLAAILLRKFGTSVAVPGHPNAEHEAEACILVPSTKVAEACRTFMVHQNASLPPSQRKWEMLPVRIVHFHIIANGAEAERAAAVAGPTSAAPRLASATAESSAQFETNKHPTCIHVVLFPSSAFPLAKSFWQHTGDGISSRRAEACLRMLEAAGKLDSDGGLRTNPVGTPAHGSADNSASASGTNTPTAAGAAGGAAVATAAGDSPNAFAAAPPRAYGRNRHYARSGSSGLLSQATTALGAGSTALTSSSSPSASGGSQGQSSSPTSVAADGGVPGVGGGPGSGPVAGPSGQPSFVTVNAVLEDVSAGEQLAYVEERYGRNLPTSAASLAKRALRKRIAATLLSDQQEGGGRAATSAASTAEQQQRDQTMLSEDVAGDEGTPTAREGTQLTEHDVFLYPTGMSAIWHAHQLAMAERRGRVGRDAADARVGKSVCFGFPYIDTLKLLEKWGPGVHFFGKGDAEDLEALEQLLLRQEQEQRQAAKAGATTTTTPPVLALFCEFPSNPLLRAPDLPRIRALADRHDFLVVVDETIGNFVNVEVLPFADVVVSSLTKVFSGDSNVMGGSLVLNPRGRHAESLRRAQWEAGPGAGGSSGGGGGGGEYEDNYWGEDAVFMERNSRGFVARCQTINANAEAAVAMLLDEVGKGVVKRVYYPSLTSPETYERCRRKSPLLPPGASSEVGRRREGAAAGGYGGLLSVTFTSEAAARAFYDALACAKGPSLGSSFTLASPYTLLAHYGELAWAERHGVESALVRISVGTEAEDEVLAMLAVALLAASRASRRAGRA